MNPTLDLVRDTVRSRLIEVCCSAAIHDLVACALSPSAAASIATLANLPNGLSITALTLRQALNRTDLLPVGYARHAVWELIDAINFWLDSRDGQWRYTDAADKQRYLQWALDGAARVEKLFAEKPTVIVGVPT